MLNRKDPIGSMTKLLDACNESSRLFFVTAPAASDSALHQLALTIWQKLSQFEFELKTELRRIGGIEAARPRLEAFPKDRAILVRECGNSLQILLQRYEETLDTTLSAHARAMVTRQSQEVHKHYEQLSALKGAA